MGRVAAKAEIVFVIDFDDSDWPTRKIPHLYDRQHCKA
jgi:hypothetical protein